MMRRIRETLADSHIAAVAIAVLLLWSITSGVVAFWGPISRVAMFIFTAIAIRDVPYVSRTLTMSDWIMLIKTSSNLFEALVSLGAAWLLARWTFGAGPLYSLSQYRTALTRRGDVE